MVGQPEPAAAGSCRDEAPPAEPMPSVPAAGERLIALFCQRAYREAILGDLAEAFALLAKERGPGVARTWYWWQAVRSFGSFAWRWAQRIIELDEMLKRIGL